ncbi:MAG TPA: hypothetical protein VI452_03325 [Marmoricola sp.]
MPATGARPVRLRRADLPFVVLLLAAAALRALVMVAYRPMLLFSDSFGYLKHTHTLHFSVIRPAGYLIFVWPEVNLLHSQAAIGVVQDLLGLGIAVACYAFALRRGLPRWVAVLVTVPVLFDPLQLVLEHYVLSDVLFEALLAAACLVLLWSPRPTLLAVVGAGLLVAACTLSRGAGTLLLGAFVVALVCLRVSWRKAVAFLLAGLVPLAAYAVAFHAQYHRYALELAGPRFLYARLAPQVHCDQVDLPSYEVPLCPSAPVGHRWPIDWYMWHGHRAPQWHVSAPPGMSRLAMIKDFDERVLRAEPVAYAASVLRQFALGFSPSRRTHIYGSPPGRWLFQDHYWGLRRLHAHHLLPRGSNGGTSSSPRAARLLQLYRSWFWIPGPLLALLLLVSLAAAFGVGRARRSGDRVAVGLLAAATVLPLLTAVALPGFSWRYQLPQLALLPVAGALGLAALVRGAAPGRVLDPPVRVLDRLTAGLARWPMPDRVAAVAAAAQQRGRLQVLAAVVLGLLAGSVCGIAGRLSGWVASPTAAVGAAVVAVCVTVMLLVSRARAARDAAAGADLPPVAGPVPAGHR